MTDLTTLQNVKQWLGISDSTQDDDALLLSLVARESAYIESWLNRKIVSRGYTETYDGTGGVSFSLPNYPITAVASVIIDGNSISPAANPLWPGYLWNEERIALNGYTFTRGHLNVQISYTAGYATVPSDIEQACIELVGMTYRERERIGLSSKGIAGEQTNFIIKDMPESVRGILNQYRRTFPQ